MRQILPELLGSSNIPAARLCSDPAELSAAAQLCSVEWGQWFKAFAHTLWPKKSAACLQYLTGAKERTSHYWTGGREPPGSIVVLLLRSAEGERVLDYIMRGSKVDWWAAHRSAKAKAALLDQTRVAIEQLEFSLE